MMSAKSWRAAWIALGIGGIAIVGAAAQPAGTQRGAADDKNWLAVAPGLVEPRSGEIKLMAPTIGVISEVLVHGGDKVLADEPLIRLADEEARARVATSEAQVDMRKRVRNEQGAGKAADRRKAEDAVADAEAALLQARDSFDAAVKAGRNGRGSEADRTAARAAWAGAQERLVQKRLQLRKLEDEGDTPLPTANEGQLTVARDELRIANAELEKLTIRAPIAGTVLQIEAKVGELAAPSAPQPLVVLGDLSALRVRAEVDERDVGKIKLGNKVLVRADAFRGREFSGEVTSIAPLVQPGRIDSPGSHNLSDFSVTEVLIDLDEPGPLVVGMKADVYFQPDAVAH
jgi:HlyD family secretion protein